MNLLEMFKNLTEEEKEEFAKLILTEINKKEKNEKSILIH